ncbi:Metal tolerance protein 5 [Cinnamomum micranthum f. kanehirae]|uniref:Metal tolerance protein 5 n=1 Tax=Cinnamomum micranthum f. kanehirae TaxID=337451 RepID=A0A3S3Q935_9MAGN|nr:Metal tolerance protein 5 [Cinnamomum micranthum f. kanehirae]
MSFAFRKNVKGLLGMYAFNKNHSLPSLLPHWDSLLDLLSGLHSMVYCILYADAKSLPIPNEEKAHAAIWGILVFASVMATLGLQIILESARTLLSDDAEFSLTKEQERWLST